MVYIYFISLSIEIASTIAEEIPPTDQPAGTIPCPYCLKKQVKGQTIVECRENDIFCGQYDGCWVRILYILLIL